MRDRLQALMHRFDALSTRERVLVLIALFAVAYQVGTLVVFDRQFEQIETLQAETSRDNQAVLASNQQIATLVVQQPADPNDALRASIEALRQQVGREREALQAETESLISPRDMALFLEQLLLQERELELMSLKTLEPEAVNAGGREPVSGVTPESATVLHRHGFDIVFSGSYLATLRYLESLEALPWRFFWDSVDYEVFDYPESTVRLRLHTLSLSEDWIGV